MLCGGSLVVSYTAIVAAVVSAVVVSRSGAGHPVSIHGRASMLMMILSINA